MVLAAYIPELSRSLGQSFPQVFTPSSAPAYTVTPFWALSWHRDPEGCKGERTDHETKLLFSGLSMANKVSGQEVHLLQEEKADCSRFPNVLTFFFFYT